jgi:hypothetical protein
MRFALPRLASHLPHLAAVLSLGLTTACGDKGDPVEPAGSSVETVFGFDSTVEGFQFEDYTPTDTTYTNIYDVAPADALISHDTGDGPDGKPGRLKLSMNFTGWNQLADIQVNYMGEEIKDWDGKTLKAKVMLESGFSPNPSCPGGTYMFAKTGAEWVWARGISDVQLTSMTAGQWQEVVFILNLPGQANAGFDPVQVRALGLQFYSNSGGQCSEDADLPQPVVAYVDAFTIEDSEE